MNHGQDDDCLGSTNWRLWDESGELEYEQAVAAEEILKEWYNLDFPGAFPGTCIDSESAINVFVSFDVNPDNEFVFVFRKSDGGFAVGIGSNQDLALALAISASATNTNTTILAPTNTYL